ncbi:hypothetical protein P8610_06750 [Fictibacillus sp. UD]|uniref:hypothetical protein n=1 Tax=Fictibacillus sp. UD TaxID=3038777 RepID=UPI00374557DB
MIFGEEYNDVIQTIAKRYIWHITKIPPREKHGKDLKTENDDEYDDEDKDKDKDKDYDYELRQGVLLQTVVKFKCFDRETFTILNSNKAINQVVRKERKNLKKELEETVNNITKYIGVDFLITKYQEVHGMEGRDYLEFGKMFKDRSLEDISEIKEKYFQFFPTNLLISIIKLENYLNSGIIHVAGDLESIEKVYLKKSKFNLNEFRENLFRYGKRNNISNGLL